MSGTPAAGGGLSRLPYLLTRALYYYRRDGLAVLARQTILFLGLRLPARLVGYDAWRFFYDRLTRSDRRAIRRDIAGLTHRPLMSLVVPPAGETPSCPDRTIRSLQDQLYPHWELLIAGSRPEGMAPDLDDSRIRFLPAAKTRDAVSSRQALLEAAAGEFVAVLDPGDTLSPQALYRVAREADRAPDAGVIYSDEDRIDDAGRHRDPWFKGDWDPDLFLSQNFLGRLCAVRRSLILAAGGLRPGFGGSADHDLLLRVTETLPPDQIRHIPAVLCHRTGGPTFNRAAGPVSKSEAEAARRLILDHLARRSITAEVVPVAASPGRFRLRRPLSDPAPLVSAIIPTRDRVDLLRPCVDGLLDGTDYAPLEIIVIDNGSTDRETLAYLREVERRGVRVLRDDGPFNYAALNNGAVGVARGSILAFLNNDIKVIHRDWLREMVAEACRPEIGAVGAKLYFPNDTLQHAGVVIGLGGVAGHLHLAEPRDSRGYFEDVLLARSVSCVTAACLVMRREPFEAVGGFDEDRLPVAFNDVDLCLKIRERGLRILWTPFAELYHYESASRGSDMAPDKIERFRRDYRIMCEKWGPTLASDPCYSPNRTQDGCGGGLAFPPRAHRPWRAGKRESGKRRT